MVDRLRVLRAWILRRSLLAGLPLGVCAALLAWVAASDAYPGWLKAICLPVLLVPSCVLAMDLRDVASRARRCRRRSSAEFVQPALALFLALLIAGAPRFLVPVQEAAPVLADLPSRRPAPPPAEQPVLPAPSPQLRDVRMQLLEPLEDVIAAETPVDPVPPPPPPAPPAPVAAAPVAPPATPAEDDLEGLRFQPELDDLLAFIHRSPGRKTPALPPSLRVEMTLYLDEAEDPEGSGFLAEVDYALGLDEGIRVFFHTTAESQDEGLFDDGPTWAWQRARIDYVRRLPFIAADAAFDLRISAGLAFDRFRVTEEVGISEARGGAPVLGIELAILNEGPVRLLFHAAYTPATDLADHHAVVMELGATAFIRVTDAIHLTIGWRFVEVRLREEVDGVSRRWDDEVAGPAFGIEIRL